MNRNLWLVVVCQGLFLTNNVTFIAINGLVGLNLAPPGWMATLPVMGYVVGGALSTGMVARMQSRYGRKTSFQLGLGRNFLFTGSTTLALTAYRPEEKDGAQGALNFCVFAMLALSSLASGVRVTTQGWTLLNLGSLLPLGLTGLALGWLALTQRRHQNHRFGFIC